MFSKATLGFLDELVANNERAWFEENKPRYEALVREPALEFIAAMAAPLAKFAPHWTLAGDSLTRPPRGYAAERFAAAAPLMKFLCEAQGVQH